MDELHLGPLPGQVWPGRGRPCEHRDNDRRCPHGCAWARTHDRAAPAPQPPQTQVADRDLHLPKPGDPTLTVFVRKGDPLPWPVPDEPVSNDPPAPPPPTAAPPTPARRRPLSGRA